MIEAAIDHEVSTHWIRESPKIAYGVRPEIRLRKMPDFARDSELLQWMRNRKCLGVLRATDTLFRFFRDDEICIVMEAGNVIA